jgi:rare lipoprotein A
MAPRSRAEKALAEIAISQLHLKKYHRATVLISALGFLLLSTACMHRRHVATRMPPQYPPATRRIPPVQPPEAPAPVVQGEEGIASWYGHPYHGRPTANGEIYNMYDMTAAHRTLPFGTEVRVHDLENGRSVIVRINDRGPFVEGRIIDLSYAAAQAMSMPGTARVRLQIMGYGSEGQPAPPPGIFTVQVGAFREFRNAQKLKSLIERNYGPVFVESFDRGDGVFHRVRVGRVSSEAEARELAQSLRAGNFASETFVVRAN